MKYKNILIFIIIFLLILMVLKCKNSLTPENITITGRVILEDTTDFSGVKVSLYEPVDLDTALVRINETYPNIGIPISQETEFDHREHNPIISTITDKEGNWKIEKVKSGNYNIVVEKEGWGWKYIFNNQKNDIINLNRAKYIKGNLGDIKFENDFIIVDDNVIQDISTIWTFKGQNIMLINDNYKITIKGNWEIMPGSKLFLFSKNSNSNARVIFENIKNLQLNNIIEINNITFTIFSSNIKLKNSIFKNINNQSLYIKNSNFLIENSILKNSFIAMALENLNNFICQNNIFNTNKKDLYLFSIDSININNNYFNNSLKNIELIENNGKIVHNIFNRAEINLDISGKSNVKIKYNNFFSSNKNLYLTSISHQRFKIALMAQNNNFFNTHEYFVFEEDFALKDSADVRFNYWQKSNKLDIEKMMHAKYEKIIYYPFSLKPIDQSGIIKN